MKIIYLKKIRIGFANVSHNLKSFLLIFFKVIVTIIIYGKFDI